METCAPGSHLLMFLLLLLPSLLNLLGKVNASSELTDVCLFRVHAEAEAKAELWTCTFRDPLMDPVYEVRYGQDVVWQIPTNPKAVFFIAHGGDKEPLSFFDQSPNCKQCYGFPEDRALVLEALRRNYAVIMVKSVDFIWQLTSFDEWPAPMTEDRRNVARIIKEWTGEHSLEHLPMAVLGESCGGWFSSVMTLDFDIQALVSMCSIIDGQVVEHAKGALFPHTLFVPMPADAPFYLKINKTMNALKAKGVVVEEMDAWPRPISPSMFADRIPCLDTNVSANIYKALKADGWLNESDFIVVNPRIGDWRSVLEEWEVLPFCQSSNDLWLAGHVEQELNCAFGEHSLTSRENGPLFDWLDSTLFGPQLFLGLTNHMTDESEK